jgi:hypothetical protein
MAMVRTAGTLTQAAVLAFLFGSVLGSATAGEATAVPAKGDMEVRKKFAELSAKVNDQPEIRKLKEELESAQKVYQTAFDAAMTKEDAELMSAYRSWREATMERFQTPPSGRAKTKEISGYDKLTDEEKKRLFEARKQAAEAPAVKDARQKRNAAKSEDERKVAETEYKTEMRKAMLEIDPKLGDLLDKLEGKEKSPANANQH